MADIETRDWFANRAREYDAWFESPRGAFIDDVETQLVFRLLPPSRGAHVLDAGCGTGMLTEKLHRRGCRVVGVDLSRDMLRMAALKSLPVPWIRADLKALPFASISFDAIYSVCAVEFIHPLEPVLEELWRCLKPEGHLLIATIAGDSAWGDFYRERAQQKPDSIFRHAYFHTQEDLMAWRPEALCTSGRSLFVPPDAPDGEFTPAGESSGRKLRSGGFMAVLWKKEGRSPHA